MAKIRACNLCFKNYGVRYEAGLVGQQSEEKCPCCGRQGGAKLGDKELSQLKDNFFIKGSEIHIGIGSLPLRQSEFDDLVWQDYKLLEELTGTTLFWHSPHLYALGYTPLRDKIDARLKPLEREWPQAIGQDTTLDDLWEELLTIVTSIVLKGGQTFFRARVAASHPIEPSQYDSPPAELIKPNRFNDSQSQVLYAGFDVKTCLLELKLGPREIVRNEVTIARLVLKRQLHILDLSKPLAENMDVHDFADRVSTLQSLLFPSEDNYYVSQSLAQYIQKRGLDGILHPSAFRHIGDSEAKNLVLFGSPIKEGTVGVLGINRVGVRAINYDIHFGPAYQQISIFG
jgi:hypothetical protein